ncbi:MAG TPA: protoporphyrinogen oxidase, partial [Acidimicrobiaceae bacterium]|nr:protoporphyrinogen oxidase [Acidimicrobiaceae bacterium]
STGGRTGDLTGARPLRLTTTDGEVVDADAVVVTAPAPAAASLLADAAPRTAALLRRIEYASVAVVTLGFARSQIRHRLDAAGMIVAAGEGLLTTACSFASSKWPHWADADEVVLRASVGRHGDGRAVSMDDDELVAAVRDELAPLLGITGEPARRRVSRWHHALPQYFRGHRSLVAEIESCLADETAEPSPGRVVLAGAAYRGLGVPACIAQAEAAAAAVLAALAGEERRQSAP